MAEDDGWGSLEQAASEEHLPAATQVIEERVKSILSSNDSPDINFDLSINPYRGCEHGCSYCFARPTHSYLNLSPGLDFETRIIAKVNAAQRLREAFASRGYEPLLLNIGSATDAYQPVERRLRITRSVVEVLHEHSHAFSLVTKSAGVERDLDLIAPMAERRLAAIYVSITTLDAGLSRILEPRAASPERRLRTIGALARAGVPVGGQHVAGDSFHQRTRTRTRAGGGGFGRRAERLQRGAEVALGGEPDLPAMAEHTLPRPRRARDGARA